MKTLLGPETAAALTDVSDWCELVQFSPSDADLSQQIGSSEFILEEADGVVVPILPKKGYRVQHYDDDGVTLRFDGFLREMRVMHPDVGRGWDITCQDANVRALEAQIGTLSTYLATTDNDRNMVIAIFRAGLKQKSLSATSQPVDDPIITANEPNWPGVHGTAFLSGIDFSGTVKAAMDKLTAAVPNVYWRIDPDLVVQYGQMRALAPFALSTSPDGATAATDDLLARYGMDPMMSQGDELITGDHRNRLSYTGAGATTVVATDEVSYATHRRILEADPVTDPTTPAGLVKQFAYATLRAKREKRHLTATCFKAGLKAGMLLDVVNERMGDGSRPAPWLDLYFAPIAGRSASGELAKGAGYRGRVLVQKIGIRPIGGGPGGTGYLEYDLECGDAVRDLPTALAIIAGAGT